MKQLTFADALIHDTLAEARAHVRKERMAQAGVRCPCCDLFVKVYRRKLNSGIARGLIALAHAHRAQNSSDFIHINDVLNVMVARKWRHPLAPTAQIPLARFWGLVETRAPDSPDKHSSGFWRLTESGYGFVYASKTIPKYVMLFNNMCMGLDGDLVNIDDCLGSGFKYRELMEGV